MDNVNQFIEQLIKDQGLPQLDEAVHKQMVSDLSVRLTQFLNKRLIEAVPPEAMPELEQLLDQQPPDMSKIQEFIASKLPNMVEITANAMVEFRSLYLGDKA